MWGYTIELQTLTNQITINMSRVPHDNDSKVMSLLLLCSTYSPTNISNYLFLQCLSATMGTSITMKKTSTINLVAKAVFSTITNFHSLRNRKTEDKFVSLSMNQEHKWKRSYLLIPWQPYVLVTYIYVWIETKTQNQAELQDSLEEHTWKIDPSFFNALARKTRISLDTSGSWSTWITKRSIAKDTKNCIAFLYCWVFF